VSHDLRRAAPLQIFLPISYCLRLSSIANKHWTGWANCALWHSRHFTVRTVLG